LRINRSKNRRLKLWWINHLESKRRKETAHRELKHTQRPWRLPRKLEELDFSRYPLRIRTMFEKLKEIRKVKKLPLADEKK